MPYITCIYSEPFLYQIRRGSWQNINVWYNRLMLNSIKPHNSYFRPLIRKKQRTWPPNSELLLMDLGRSCPPRVHQVTLNQPGCSQHQQKPKQHLSALRVMLYIYQNWLQISQHKNIFACTLTIQFTVLGRLVYIIHQLAGQLANKRCTWRRPCFFSTLQLECTQVKQ